MIDAVAARVRHADEEEAGVTCRAYAAARSGDGCGVDIGLSDVPPAGDGLPLPIEEGAISRNAAPDHPRPDRAFVRADPDVSRQGERSGLHIMQTNVSCPRGSSVCVLSFA